MGNSNFASRMFEGRLVGYHMRTGAVLLMTKDGIVRGRGVRRLAEDQAWSTEGIDELCGVPRLVVNRRVRLEKKVTADKESTPTPPPVEKTARAEETTQRKRYVLA